MEGARAVDGLIDQYLGGAADGADAARVERRRIRDAVNERDRAGGCSISAERGTRLNGDWPLPSAVDRQCAGLHIGQAGHAIGRAAERNYTCTVLEYYAARSSV